MINFKEKEFIPGKFSLCMPSFNTKFETVCKAIDSILCQSYENFEIILALDGLPFWDVKDLENKYKDEPKLKILVKQHTGVCDTRNKAAEISNGEFISFFSCDFIMKSGCLKTWYEEFTLNPDIDFLYSGYSMHNKDFQSTSYYASEEYSRWKIEQYNIIDGGMPIRRTKCPKWDIQFKYLNDYDWALTISETCKIKYLKDYIPYSALEPQPGGLSNQSHDNWELIINRIWKKHNIIQPKVNCISFGAPFHAEKLAKKFGWHSNLLCTNKSYNYNHIHILGIYKNSIPAILKIMETNPLSKISLHWIGTDVRQIFEETNIKTIKEYKEKLFSKVLFSATECEATQKILNYAGINTHILPLPVDNPFGPKIIPEIKNDKFTIAIYRPEEGEKYNSRLMDDVVMALPQYNFVFYGNKDGRRGIFGNTEWMGWVDIKEVIEKSNCLLRVLPFDGLSISVIEFLMTGRSVIYSEDFNKTYHVSMKDIMSSEKVYEECLNVIIDYIYFIANERTSKIKKESIPGKKIRMKKYTGPASFFEKTYSKETFLTKFNSLSGGK